YALWAYNGWGWVNNPNNPRFTRVGTPATNPAAFPYQERVLYLVAHPLRDADGNPLWQPVAVTLPSKSTIGPTPKSYLPKRVHRQPAPSFSASFRAPRLPNLRPGTSEQVSVRLENTGLQGWESSGASAISLTYHLFTS